MNPHAPEALLKTLRDALGPCNTSSLRGSKAYKPILKAGAIIELPPNDRGETTVCLATDANRPLGYGGHWQGCKCSRCDGGLSSSPDGFDDLDHP